MFNTAFPTGRMMEVELMNRQSDWVANYESTLKELTETIFPKVKMIKYKTSKYGGERITKVEVERETSSMVYVKENWGGTERIDRCLKMSNSTAYFDTFQEAKDYLIKEAQERVDMYTRSLQKAKSDLGVVQSLKEIVSA